MRIYIITLLILSLFNSCKSDPNKQVDEGKITNNRYHSEEIGWTMEIPKDWDITNRDISQKIEDIGLKAITEANDIEYDASGLKQLLSFQKDKFHMFSATSEKFELEYIGEYEENSKLVNELLYNTYSSNGITIDTSSSIEIIDNLEFNVFKVLVFDPQGKIILYQDLYSIYRNGLDFGVNLNYINEADKLELIRVWKNSKFE